MPAVWTSGSQWCCNSSFFSCCHGRETTLVPSRCAYSPVWVPFVRFSSCTRPRCLQAARWWVRQLPAERRQRIKKTQRAAFAANLLPYVGVDHLTHANDEQPRQQACETCATSSPSVFLEWQCTQGKFGRVLPQEDRNAALLRQRMNVVNAVLENFSSYACRHTHGMADALNNTSYALNRALTVTGLCDQLATFLKVGMSKDTERDATIVTATTLRQLSELLHSVASYPDSPSETVTQLASFLLAGYVTYTASLRGSEQRCLVTLEELFKPCVLDASPNNTGAVIQALTRAAATADCEEAAIARCFQWHPIVSVSLVKICLKQIVHVLQEKQKGKHHGNALSDLPYLAHLHRCSICGLPSEVLQSPLQHHDSGTEIAYLSLRCLKQAPIDVLCDVYTYYEKEGFVTHRAINRFLAHCSMNVVGLSQRGLTTRKVSQDILLEAMDNVLRMGRDAAEVEEALVSSVTLSLALGHYHHVNEIYRLYPTLRETAFSIVARAVQGDIQGAITALTALGASRPEGWVRLPPVVFQAMATVCRLVGQGGNTTDIEPLYRALVGFHNAGLLISQLVEYILGGLCDRLRNLDVSIKHETKVVPKTIIESFIPMVRHTLLFVGDDMNTDMVMELLETAVQMPAVAVPLTTALVWTLQRASSNSIQELFLRIDASTHQLPFLMYFALSTARNVGRGDVLEHLASVWNVDPAPIARRDPHLAPSYKLWRCTSCGRLNSDRFNYCVCSSLRNGLVACGNCHYIQNERLLSCRSCGTLMNEHSIAAVVARKSWTCSACTASNPAMQTLLCFRCSKPTGPASRQYAKSRPNVSFCNCADSDGASHASRTYEHELGFCRHCSAFRCEYAAHYSRVWRCVGCEQLRSSLERTCPSCPQVECLPFAMEHTAHTVRFCWDCFQEEHNAFAPSCSGCGSEALHVSPAPPSAKEELESGERGKQVSPLPSAPRNAKEELLFPFYMCQECGTLQADVKDTAADGSSSPLCCTTCGCDLQRTRALRLSLSERSCVHCTERIPASDLSAMCPHCLKYVGPPEALGWSTLVLTATCAALAQCAEAEAGGQTEKWRRRRPSATSRPPTDIAVSGGSSIVRKILLVTEVVSEAWRTGIDASTWSAARTDMFLFLHRLITRLYAFVPYDLEARRCVALLKQLLMTIDRRCGLSQSPAVYYLPEEFCSLCLGGHVEALCEYAPTQEWSCAQCGAENTNKDVCRYVCTRCLTLRPEVQNLFPAECWSCTFCGRANLEFERFCIHCAHQKDFDLLHPKGTQPGTNSSGTVLLYSRQTIPFVPNLCEGCGLVYLEARCPLCTSHEERKRTQRRRESLPKTSMPSPILDTTHWIEKEKADTLACNKEVNVNVMEENNRHQKKEIDSRTPSTL